MVVVELDLTSINFVISPVNMIYARLRRETTYSSSNA